MRGIAVEALKARANWSPVQRAGRSGEQQRYVAVENDGAIIFLATGRRALPTKGHMPQSLARLHVHLVFSTKNRAPILHDGIREALHSYMGGVLQTLRCGPVLTNSVEDHVHLLFELSRTIALSEVVGEAKRLSSRWIKAQEAQFAKFSWQRGYAAFAVSKPDVTSVHNYIANQREHHRAQDFQPELRALLEDNGIAFDEQYVWD